jgi:hypothetical protein
LVIKVIILAFSGGGGGKLHVNNILLSFQYEEAVLNIGGRCCYGVNAQLLHMGTRTAGTALYSLSSKHVGFQ